MLVWSRRPVLRPVLVAVLALFVAGCASGAASPAPPAPGGASASPAPSAVPPAATPAATASSAATSGPTTASPISLPDLAIRTFSVHFAWTAPFAVDRDGHLYIPTGTEGAALTKLAPDGRILATWASPETVPGQPDTVAGVAIDPADGDVWVSDATSDQVVRLTSDLEQVSSFGGTGPGEGRFSSPGGLALLPDGTIVVADMGGDRVEYFDRDGTFLRQVIAPGGRIAPYDVAADGTGNVWVTGSQPGAFGEQAGMAVKLGADGAVLQRVDTVPGGKTWFPSVAVAGDRVLVADAWQGLLELQADGSLSRIGAIGGGLTSAATVRVAPGGDIYTLACTFASTSCVIERRARGGARLASWRALGALPTPAGGTTVQVDGRDMYLQCIGEDSPTIVWISGHGAPGWLSTAQYLQSQLATVSRVCMYDRQGLGFSESAGYADMDHWLNDTADLAALLQAAKVDGPYVMAGHSYGGLLARIFAYEHRKDVAGVLAIDPSSENQFSQELVNPDAPTGDPTCTSCPFYPDIEAVHEMTKGKVAGSLGDLPLIVLGHAPDLPFWPGAYNATWLDLGRETATASSNAEFVTASWSSHSIPTSQPALVVEALRELVAAARSTSHELPACGEALTAVGGVCD